MSDLVRKYEVTRKDLVKNKALKTAVWLTPVIFSIVPAVIFFFLFMLSTATPAAAVYLFLTLISFVIGLIVGSIVSGGLMFYRQKWLASIRELIAIDGIKAEEVDWFKNELTSQEKIALKEIDRQDRLLADAYRETLASRLTATRIIKTSKRELMLVQKRQNKLKYLKTDITEELQNTLKEDAEKLAGIKTEAEQMRVEAETRLQMIEAATRREMNFADTELALKKLSARSAELPLALESLKMEENIRKELEAADK